VTVAVVGSTGSIGTQAVDVIESNPDRYRVTALGAHRSVEALAAQARRLRPEVVAIGDPDRAPELARLLPPGIDVVVGAEGLASAATVADVAVNGIVGFAGLRVTLAALGAGRRLALANKESIIAGAPVVQEARRTEGAEIIPVDSEHCAVHQCLRAGRRQDVGRLLLTASGGPFRGWKKEELAGVQVADALTHPTWTMGPKITVDSSTLMNKGLEVIEAHELFGVPYDAIDVVVHPQSIVHSMVEFADGATIIQASPPDMRIPIALGLAWPDRVADAAPGLDWTTAASWTFEPLDDSAFPAVALAREAARLGGTAPAVYNGANEACVADFLAGRISFPAIVDTVARVVSEHDTSRAGAAGVDDVLAVDAWARARAREITRSAGA
jgi:1-deoxy-D-xylulose-5-phosphate reductoisomerase